MTTYTVYFELFGKKMKTDVLADSPAHAERIIRDKIVFHKVIPASDDLQKQAEKAFDDLMNIFKGFNK